MQSAEYSKYDKISVINFCFKYLYNNFLEFCNLETKA